LGVLGASEAAFRLLRDDEIGVVMEPSHIVAQQQCAALPVGADIEFGSGALVEASNIADGHGGAGAVGRDDNDLRAEPDFAGVDLFVAAAAVAAVNVRFGLDEEFEEGREGQFRDLVNADAGPEFGRCHGAQAARLELQVPHRS